MSLEIFEIPSFQVDMGSGPGQYLFATEIAEETSVALDGPAEGEGFLMEIPRLEGVNLLVRRLGKGMELTTHLGKEAWVTSYLALDEASGQQVREAAIEKAAAFGWEDMQVSPEWRGAMEETLPTPFSVVVPSPRKLSSSDATPAQIEKVQMATGYVQAVMAALLKQAGCVGKPMTQEELMGGMGMAESRMASASGSDFAAAVQTGGEPHGTLIVSPNGDCPNIYANIMDLELDVFRVDFLGDGEMNIDCSNLSYLMCDRRMLKLIQVLSREADDVWAEVREAQDEYEERVAKMEENGEDIDLPDPFLHLYTDHESLDVPQEMADMLRTELGLGARQRN